LRGLGDVVLKAQTQFGKGRAHKNREIQMEGEGGTTTKRPPGRSKVIIFLRQKNLMVAGREK